MDSIIRRYKFILLVALLVEAQNSSTDQTLPEPRRIGTTGRIVKLYAGYKSEPVNCIDEGFQADPKNCGIFYRCMKSGKGKFTVFKFECAPGTVYDPEIEVCNYPRSTKRVECGGLSNGNMNEIDEVYQELPSPIITKAPIYTEGTTTPQNSENIHDVTHQITTTTTTEQHEMNKATLPTSTLVTSSSYSVEQFTGSPTMQPFSTTTASQTTYFSNVTSDIGLFLSQKPNLQNNLCTFDGFMGDYENCHKFYRCVGNQIGGFTRYEFSCSDSTVWDDDIQACNHPWAVKKSRCGKSGNNIDSTKVLGILHQSTSSNNQHFVDHDDNNKHKQQVQLDYVHNLTQDQTPIVHQKEVQNKTQMNYGDRTNKLDKPSANENQIQMNYELAVSQIQGQKNNGNEEAQTQTDHSSQLGQTSTTMSNPITNKSSSTYVYTNQDKYSTHINVEKSNECTRSGFMGNSNNCKIFYRCVDNGKGGYTRHDFSCGEGTLWDQKLEACNHAWAVKNCGSTQLLQEPHIVTSTSTMKPTQHYITSTQTTENYIAILEETNHNGENIGYNNHDPNPFTTTLPHALITTTTNSLQPANNECKTSGFMSDMMSCEIFYRCVDDGKGGYTKYKFQCGEGTIWDSNIDACNHATAVKNCGGNVVMSTVETSSKGTATTGNSTTESSYIATTLHQINTESSSNKSESGYDFHNDAISSTTNTVVQNIDRFNECKSVGFVGDKNDCKKFYRCVDNGSNSFTRYEFSCGEGTVWDPTIESCNHVWAVNTRDCSRYEIPPVQEETILNTNTDNENSTRSTTIIITTTFTEHSHTTEHSSTSTKSEKTSISTSSISSSICKSEGFFADYSNCKKFYRCVDNGKGYYNKFEFICSDGTIWNEETAACDRESSNNKCVTNSLQHLDYTTERQQTLDDVFSSTTQEREHNTPKNQSSTNNHQCSSEGFHVDPRDCRKFYRCVINNEGGFTKYDFSCAEGTIWIQDIQSCDYDNGITNCSLQNEFTYKQPEDSQHSSTSTAITSVTSTSQVVFSSKDNDNNTTDDFTGNDCSSEGYYGDKKDCKKFYRCVDNGNGGLTKYDFTCGEGTAWDENIKGCNHMNLVESCQNSNNTSEIVTDGIIYTSTMPTTIVQEPTSTDSNEMIDQDCEDSCNEEGYFGSTSDCKKFYRCVDDGKDGFIKYDFTCGDGTIWDQDINACNHPQDVASPSCQSDTENSTTDCLVSMNTTTISPTTQSSTSSTQHGEQLPNTTEEESSKQPVNNNFTCTEAGFFPNPNDCKKFYRCVDWDGDGSKFTIFHFECGEGTIWDPELDTCNHEESVYPSRDCSGTQSQTENTENGSSTTEATTTQEISTQQTSTSNPQTTMQTTTQQTTTSERTTTQQTTTQQSTTKDNTTTQETTTSIQTTSEQTTLSQQPTTTTSQTTVQTTTNSEQSTTTQSTTLEETTTPQSTTTTTEKEATTKEPTTTQSTTLEETTTQQSTTTTTEKEATTKEPTTTQSTTLEETTTQQSTTTTTEKEATTKEPTTTTEISSESTTIENTTTQTSTTEQNTQQTTDNNQVTTTEQATVTQPHSTTESSTTDESMSTTTQSSTSETSTNKGDQETTTESTSTSTQKCPETDDDQYLFVCPTSFRRHPKYCNLFYQCTEEDDSHDAKIAVFTCPNNTIYDESKIQCVEEDKAEKSCDGEIASRRRVKRLGFNYKESIVVTADSHSCSATGYVPFEKNSECSPAFMKCEKSKSGKLRGYVYQCPENYIYWSISRRCERRENVRDCKRTTNNWNGRWEIPIEKHNVAW